MTDDSAGGLTDGYSGHIVGIDWKIVLQNNGTNVILADNEGPTRTVELLFGNDPNRDAVDAGISDNQSTQEVGRPAITNVQGQETRAQRKHCWDARRSGG